MRRWFRSAFLPFWVGVGVACIVVSTVWALPAAFASPRQEAETGPLKNVTWVARETRSQSFEWSSSMEVFRDPGAVNIHPRLINTVAFHANANPGHADLIMHSTILINGIEAYEGYGGWETDERTANSNSTAVSSDGFPSFESIDQGLLRQGSNEIRFLVDLNLTVFSPGSGVYEVSMGPLRLTTFWADRDHDGVTDNLQLVPPVHSGLVAFAMAGGMGTGAFFGTKWVQRRRRSLPRSDPERDVQG